MIPPTTPPRPLGPELAAIRRRNPDLGPFFDEIVFGLRAVGVGASAPVVGDTFPDFSLPNVDGGYRRLGDVLEEGPVVINFSRGRWCPYCVHEISAWADMLPAVADAGARFIEITGETGGGARAIAATLAAADHASTAEILCDVDHGVALSLGLAFFAGEPMLDFYRKRGLDFHALYGSQSGFLPVPGTFTVGRDGVVRYAFVDVDFRNRAEPAEVIAALAGA
ncbi:MAG: peroxiredoxin-like family protein [Novosphingobium sp.]